MRRASIVGPLILIGLGLLFLMRNFIPEFRVFDVLSHYWPYLLIGWGGLRVVEILIWHTRGQLTPRGGMNGGEWALVVFICLIGTAIFEARNASFFRNSGIDLARWDLLGESFDFAVNGTQAGVGKTPRVVIENSRGNVRVTGVDSEEIRVSGTKSIRAVTRDDAAREDKSTAFEITRSGDQILIRTNLERATHSRQAKADLEVTVPKGAQVEARGKYGDVDMENIGGMIEVSSENAGVRINNAGADVRVDLRRSDIVRVNNAKGNVELKGRGNDVELENIAGTASMSGQYSGEMRFRNLAKPFRFESQSSNLRVERIEGDVELSLGRLTARRITGPLQFSSKSKDVEIADFTGPVEVDLERGDIHLRPQRMPLTKTIVRTRSGNAELVLPDGAKLDLKAEVKKGSIANDFGVPFRLSEEGRSATLSGTNGGPEFHVNVDRGEIRVRRWSTAETVDAPSGPGPGNAPKGPGPAGATAPKSSGPSSANAPKAPLEVVPQ